MGAEAVGMSTERLERVGAACRRYVDSGRFPCTDVQVARRGRVVYRDVYGHADVATGRELADDAIFRIYSMTKPITSIALMQLYEQGDLLLENRVSRFIPEFGESRVWSGGTPEAPEVRPPEREITVHDVMTHMSGLTYGFMFAHPVDAIYRDHGLGDFTNPKVSLAQGMVELAGMPLLFDPGSRWQYSMSTDVCGRIVEVVSGMTLDAYFDEHIFGPLGMVDTGFWLSEEQLPRLPACYTRTAETRLHEINRAAHPAAGRSPAYLSGGGGLLSSTADYQRFCDMLLNRGELDGNRVIGPRTLAYMVSNHLPGGSMLNEMGQSTFSEAAMEGTGFGLGFSVLADPAVNQAIGTVGEYGWGGAASTAFWIDPKEELSVIFMTQLLPSNTYPIRRSLKSVVHQAIID